MNDPIAASLDLAVQHLPTGNLGAAEAQCRQVLADTPDQFAALNLLGVVAMQTGHLEAALELFQKSAAANPQFLDAHLNLGNLYRQAKHLAEAETAFRACAALDDNDIMVKFSLGTVLHEQGRNVEALQLLRACHSAAPGTPQIMFALGCTLAETGEFAEAATMHGAVSAQQPDNVDARMGLALALQKLGQNEQAMQSLQEAIALQPDNASAHNNLAVLQRHNRDFEAARASLENALRLNPEFVEAHNNMGHTLAELGDMEGALGAFRGALALSPDDVGTLTNMAGLGERSNRIDIAQPAIARGLELTPDDPDLNLLAAKLERRDGDARAAIDRLEKFDLGALRSQSAIEIAFELGQLFDREGETDAAFAAFTAANAQAAAMPAHQQVDKNEFLALIDAVDRQLTPEWVSSWQPTPEAAEGDAPVFMVGFPRSGTTLIQQALESHPALTTLDEKPIVDAMLAATNGYPASIADMDGAEIARLRTHYMEAAASYGDVQNPALLIDKMPLNIPYIPLIARVFPNAKFVLVLRHPCDACLSGFMQNFIVNSAMANFFTLSDAATLYDKSMRLWQRTADLLDLNCHTVRYEDVVSDFDQEVGGLLQFLGVDWDDAVRDYAKTAQAAGKILTPSYQQVTEPIYERARYR